MATGNTLMGKWCKVVRDEAMERREMEEEEEEEMSRKMNIKKMRIDEIQR